MSKLMTLTGRRGPAHHGYRASRYTHLVPLDDGSTLAWNALGGELARWSASDVAAYAALSSASAAPPESGLIERLARARHICKAAVDEVDVVRSLYDRERYGSSVLSLAHFVRGAEWAAPQEPMSAAVRAGVAGLVLAAAPNLIGIDAVWAGHEPLTALGAVADLSLRLAEFAAARRLRYTAAVHTDGAALTPAVAGKLPALEIRHVELRVRTRGGLRALDRTLDHLRAALELGQLDFHLSLELDPEHPELAVEALERLAGAAAMSARRPALSLGGGPFRSCHVHTGLSALPEREVAILERAQRLGFSVQPLPRFLSQCQATKYLSYAVAPNGDLHKCWNTVARTELRSANVCDARTLQLPSAHRQRWMFWDPFADAVCRECSILPLCAGHCADLFPEDPAARPDDGTRPCPPAKRDLKERLLAAARMKGILGWR
jgi:uncharacterized protein